MFPGLRPPTRSNATPRPRSPPPSTTSPPHPRNPRLHHQPVPAASFLSYPAEPALRSPPYPGVNQKLTRSPAVSRLNPPPPAEHHYTPPAPTPAGLRPPTSTPSTPTTTARARRVLPRLTPGRPNAAKPPTSATTPRALTPRPLQHRFLACDRPPAPTPATARARRCPCRRSACSDRGKGVRRGVLVCPSNGGVGCCGAAGCLLVAVFLMGD